MSVNMAARRGRDPARSHRPLCGYRGNGWGAEEWRHLGRQGGWRASGKLRRADAMLGKGMRVCAGRAGLHVGYGLAPAGASAATLLMPWGWLGVLLLSPLRPPQPYPCWAPAGIAAPPRAQSGSADGRARRLPGVKMAPGAERRQSRARSRGGYEMAAVWAAAWGSVAGGAQGCGLWFLCVLWSRGCRSRSAASRSRGAARKQAWGSTAEPPSLLRRNCQ